MCAFSLLPMHTTCLPHFLTFPTLITLMILDKKTNTEVPHKVIGFISILFHFDNCYAVPKYCHFFCNASCHMPRITAFWYMYILMICKGWRSFPCITLVANNTSSTRTYFICPVYLNLIWYTSWACIYNSYLFYQKHLYQ